MSASIRKFALTFPGPTPMPAGAKILAVGAQDGRPYLWALVNPEAPFVTRDLLVLGTGHDAENAVWRPFLGTIHGVEGGLVLHVFDEDPPF